MKKTKKFISLLLIPALVFSVVLVSYPEKAEAAISVDDSVVRVTATDADTAAVTTATFNAPANSMIIAAVNTNSNGRNVSITMSNNGAALTWYNIAERDEGDNANDDGHASAWFATTTDARSGLTVTATISNHLASAADFPSIKVYIVTGANFDDPIGATAENGSITTNNLTTTAYTSTAANSRGFAVCTDWAALGTPEDGTDVDTSDARFNIAGVISGLSAYKSTDTATVGSSVTLNCNAFGSSNADWNWISFEVLPSTAVTSIPRRIRFVNKLFRIIGGRLRLTQ